MAKWSTKRKEYQQAEVAKASAIQQMNVLAQRYVLFKQFRAAGCSIHCCDLSDRALPDDSTSVSYYILKFPGWAAIIIRGGIEELKRKSGLLK